MASLRRRAISSLWGERFAAICALAFAGYMGYRAHSFPVGGHMFPMFVTACIGVLALMMIVTTITKPAAYDSTTEVKVTPGDFKPVIFTGLAVGYFLVIFWLGYFVSTFMFLLVMPFMLGLKRPVFTVLTAVFTIAFIYAIFEMALVVRLPQGMFL